MLKTDFALYKIDKATISTSLRSRQDLRLVATESDLLSYLLLQSKKTIERGKHLQLKMSASRERAKEFLNNK